MSPNRTSTRREAYGAALHQTNETSFFRRNQRPKSAERKYGSSSRASRHQRRARAEWGLRIREIRLHPHGHSDNVGKNLFLLGPPRRWDETLLCEEMSGNCRKGDLRSAAGNVRAKPRTRSGPRWKDSIEGLSTSSEILVKFCCRRFRGSRVANISNASSDGARQGPTMRGAVETISLRVGAPAMIRLRWVSRSRRARVAVWEAVKTSPRMMSAARQT